MLYFAPLQGFTDYTYRRIFARNFRGIDAFFIPYISFKNNKPVEKQLLEIKPENNPKVRIVPQILFKNQQELKELADIIFGFGYREINLNLGCPYPMVTNTGRGAGLLPFPEKLSEIFSSINFNAGIQYSVKLRSGLSNENEIHVVAEILNQFPFSEIIYHPRLASQLYKGEVNETLAASVSEKLKNLLVLNGDINSVEDFRQKQQKFPACQSWMMGRGLLKNPFLGEEINGSSIPEKEKQIRLQKFHDELFFAYSQTLSGEGHLLNKMKQFWIYFSFSFSHQRKVFKRIKKSGNIKNYNEAVRQAFSEI